MPRYPGPKKLKSGDPNDPREWESLSRVVDDSGTPFSVFESSTRQPLEEYERLAWDPVPAETPLIRKEIGEWGGKLSFAYSTVARAKIYEAQARAIVKFALKKKFPMFATENQVEASASKIIGFKLRWEAVRDSLEEKVRIGKKLLGDDDRERRSPSF